MMTEPESPVATDSTTRAVLANRLPDPAQEGQFRCSLAVVIGIDAYRPGIPHLHTAVNDATRLAELLRAAHGYETILLAEPAAGQLVTGERLHTLFTTELPARLGQDDRLLLYLAGHGVALDGDNGPAGYLVPQDASPDNPASLLPMAELHAWLTALPCRHMLAILDCCFAGAFRWASTRHIGALPDVVHKERYDRYLRSPAWQVLTSAAYDQKALDVLGGNVLGRREADGRRHSPFALALFDALEKGDADLIPRGQGDGVITATELYLYLRQQVEVQAEAQAGHQQTPGLWPLKKHDRGEYVFLVPGHPLNLPPAPNLTDDANPYRGLKSYDQRHAELFFGREEEIEDLVQRVEQQSFVAVLGASGTGKSSLVKAGALPRLQGAAGEEGPSFRVLAPMRPTDRPLQALRELLRAELPEVLAGLGDLPDLAQDDALAQVVAHRAKTHPGQRLALTIDQFEELASSGNDAERDRFLRLLAVAVKEQPDAFRLLVTVRTDFEAQFNQPGSPLVETWQKSRYVVPPMDIEDLRQVIEEPASARVLYFDPPELVDDLIKEVVQTPGALPLLSFTLSELYVKYVHSGRDDRALSEADYQALGGVVGSLRNRASEEYDALPDAMHRLTMQRVMLRMVAVEGGELARRRVALSELNYPTDEENARVQTVLDRLVDARLLVRGTSGNPDGSRGEAYVEPAHDALVLAWDRLLRWKKQAEDYLPLHRRLAQAATEWSAARPEARSGLLWDDDPRLPQVQETLWPADDKHKRLHGRVRRARQALWPKSDTPADTGWLNGVELAFVQASVARRASGFRRIIGVTAAVMIALAGLAVFAGYQANQATVERNNAVQSQQTAVAQGNARATAAADATQKQAEAEREARRARAGELAALSPTAPQWIPQQSLLLAVEAIETTQRHGEPTLPAAEQALRQTLARPSGIPLKVTGRPDISQLVGIKDAAFSADGNWLATTSTDGFLMLWNVAELPEATLLTSQGQNDTVTAMTFSHDGLRLAAASKDNTVRIWDTSSFGADAVVLRGHEGSVEVLAFSPDDRLLASGSQDGTARIWRVSDSQSHPVVLRGDGETIRSLAFSHDGRWFAIAAGDNSLRLWDVTRLGGEPLQLAGHEGPILSLAFSPDNQWLATGSEDKTVRLWNMSDLHSESLVLRGNSFEVNAVQFSSDSRWLATSVFGGSLLWDMSNPEAGPAVLSGYTGEISIAFSPGGRYLALASNSNANTTWGKALLVDSRNTQSPRVLEGNFKFYFTRLVFSPDGRWLAGGSVLGTAVLWDLLDPQMRPTLLQGHISENSSVDTLAFSADGQWLVTATSNDDTARLWNTSNLSADPVVLLRHENPVWAVSFSSSGRWLATAAWSPEGLVRLWDMREPKNEPTVLRGHKGSVSVVQFSPDERWLASSSEDGTIRLWDVSHTEVDPIILHSGKAGRAMTFSADSQWLAAGGADGIVRLWRLLGGEFRLAELPLYYKTGINAIAVSPDSHWLAAGADGTAQLWDLTHVEDRPFLVSGQEERITVVAFSPDGHWLATAQDDKVCGRMGDFSVQLWNLEDLQADPIALSYYTEGFDWVSFSPDGRWLASIASCDYDTRILLWNMSNLSTEPVVLQGHIELITDATFSSDGRWLLTGSADDTARLWDMANPNVEPVVLQGHGEMVEAVAISPDGRWVVTGSRDNLARLWRLRDDDLMALACRISGRNFTKAEWSRYFPSESYRRTCPGLPIHSSALETPNP